MFGRTAVYFATLRAVIDAAFHGRQQNSSRVPNGTAFASPFFFFLLFGSPITSADVRSNADAYTSIYRNPLTMPTWSNQLPAVQKHQGYDLKRTPTGGSLTGIITSHDFLCCDTHYWHGRTTPCERETTEDGRTVDDSECAACRDKQPFRTHVYVSCIDNKTKEHFIFECTAHAAKALAEHRDASGDLRGCIFNATRPKGTPNGKVIITTNMANLVKNPIPEPPDLPRALSIIWRLPKSALPVEEQRFEPPRIRPDRNVLHEMRTQPDNAADPVPIGDILAANGQPKRRAK